MDELPHVLGAPEVLQPVHPEVAERHVVGEPVDDEVVGRTGEQRLAAVGEAAERAARMIVGPS